MDSSSCHYSSSSSLSSVNVGNFITVRPCLKEDEGVSSFRIWKEQMLCLLESHDLLGFVEGDLDGDAEWRRRDRLVKGWILGSIGKDALHVVWDKQTAREVWVELHSIFQGDEHEDSTNHSKHLPPIQEAQGDRETGQNLFPDKDESGETVISLNQKIFGCNKDFSTYLPRGGVEIKPNLIQDGDELDRKVSTYLPRGEVQIKPYLIQDQDGDELDRKVSTYLPRGDVQIKPNLIKHRDESGEDSSTYLPLYQAVQRGDWETAKNFFQDVNELGTKMISSDSKTALHVAVLTGKANGLVKKLVDSMPLNAAAVKDSGGDTALHNAAVVGNTEAAEIILNKYPSWLHILNNSNELAVTKAATFCRKDTLKLLLSKYEANPKHKLFDDELGMVLLIEIIASEFLDVTMDLVEKHPNLATRVHQGHSALSTVAELEALFPKLETFGCCHNFIYRRIPLKKPKCEASPTFVSGDIENVGKDGAAQNSSTTSLKTIFRVGHKMEFMIWTAIEYLVPEVKELRKKKAMHREALQLAEYLCDKIVSLPEKEASAIFWEAMQRATKHGMSEIVEMIMDKYPDVTFHEDGHGRNVFLLAATYRFENIFNLIYSMSDRRYMIYTCVDDKRNNLMHICGKLAPPHRLNLVTGAALQMQRELQWFKEMEKFVHVSRRNWANSENETPQMIFTKEHENLKSEGERWMKDTANASTIAAALIATVMFAAVFTVPGGLESDTGLPLFSNQPAFILFAVSDAVSLFTSIYSLLMFLFILTSRYAEEDFLHVLPKRMGIGLFSLFVSIAFMMVAFSATFYLVFRTDGAWYLLLLVAFAFFPVASFVLLQFPLLVDVVYSTYGPGIFGKKTHRFLY